jgi:hypothetical protein
MRPYSATSCAHVAFVELGGNGVMACYAASHEHLMTSFRSFDVIFVTTDAGRSRQATVTVKKMIIDALLSAA